MPKAQRRAFSIVLHPGTLGGAPCGAQYLFFRLGKLFQGGFPAQGGALVRAALQIGKAYRAPLPLWCAFSRAAGWFVQPVYSCPPVQRTI